MDADRIRELVARREGEKLDFKKQQYARDKGGAAELAKDVMAMANVLRATDEPGCILVGVETVEPERTGRITGIVAADSEDEASYQQRVGSHLNRTPSFSFAAVDVAGQLVGVFTIRPGGRPFFPLRDIGDGTRDKKILLRHVALVRRGSSTDVASPSEIIEWSRIDDPDAQELKHLQLRQMRIATQVRPILLRGSTDNSVDGGDGVRFSFVLKNDGENPFRVRSLTYSLGVNDMFLEHVRASNLCPVEVIPREALDGLKGQVPVPAESVRRDRPYEFHLDLRGRVFRDAMVRAGVPIREGFSGKWVNGELVVQCEDASGATGSDRLDIFWPRA